MILSRYAAALVDVPGYFTDMFHSKDARQQQQQQLYALLVTCLKCCMSELKEQQQQKEEAWPSTADAQEAAIIVANICAKVLRCLNYGVAIRSIKGSTNDCSSSDDSVSSSGSSNGSSNGSSSCAASRADMAAAAVAAAAAPWVALLARCLFALAAGIDAGDSTEASSTSDTAAAVQNASATFSAASARSAGDVMPAVAMCMEALSGYLGTAGLPAQVLQQLLQQHAAEEEQLQMMQSGAAQQLRSFAQAVMGRIPLSTACNHPGCSNLAQRSELVLVGGKSCVCACCKAARCETCCHLLIYL
jgi:hypothetical protein